MIKIYTSPSCSSCRKVKKWFDEQQIPYEAKNIFGDTLSVDDVKEVIAKAENGTDDIISTRSKIVSENNINFDDMTISELIDFIRKNDGVEVKLRYSSGRKRIMIPNVTCLLHVSPVAGIKELEPTFKSKTEGKYMYPSKRVYFTLGRKVKSNKAGLEKQKKSYKYTPKENVQTAYIDPALANYKVGAALLTKGGKV